MDTRLRLSVAEGLLLTLKDRPTQAAIDSATALLEGRTTLSLARGGRVDRRAATAARRKLEREIKRLRPLAEADSKADREVDPGTERAPRPAPTIKLKSPQKCPACGASLPVGSASCPSCGSDVSKTSSAAATPPTLNLDDGDIPASPAPLGVVTRARRMVQAADQDAPPTARIRSQARPAGRARGRGGRGAGRNTADQAFDKKHPRVARGRVGGGQFARKGDGMGDEGPSDRVNQLQQRLKQLGYNLAEDGRFGPATEAAVRAFQHDYGLEETGTIDAATLETIRRPPERRVTQVIAEREAAERAERASSSSSSDGGSSTSDSSSSLDTSDPEAVRRFQREHGLTVDGIVGPETRAAMRDGESSRDDSGGASRSTSRSGSARRAGERRRVNIPGIGSVTGDTLRLGVGMGRRADGDVRTIQTLLDDLGFDLGEAGVDGRFGPDTARAVRDLQAKYGLAVDGVVGPETKALLKRIARRHLRRRERLDVDALVSEAATTPPDTTWETRMATIEKRLEEAVAARKAASGGAAFAQARARETTLRRQLAEAQFAHFDSGDGAFHTVICDGCKKSGGLRKLAEVPLGGKMAVEFKCECGHLTRVLNSSIEYVVPGRSSEANATRSPMQEAARGFDANLHPRDREGQFRDVLGGLKRPSGGLTSAMNLSPEQKVANFRRMHGRDPSPAQMAKLRGGARPRGRTPKQQARFDAATSRAASAARDRHARLEGERVAKLEARARAHEEHMSKVRALVDAQMRRTPDAQRDLVFENISQWENEWIDAEYRKLGLREAADSMVKASTHKRGLERKRGNQDNWVERTGPGGKGGQLPAYIQHIALALVRRRGMDRSRAIAIAIGTVKRWARGGGDVDSNTRAAARKALAEWEAMKAKARAT